MTQQTNALRLADCIQPYNVATPTMLAQASAELRRLDAVEAERDQLRAQVERLHGGEPSYSTGHCKEKAKPGGCSLHNIHCEYPKCDRVVLSIQPAAPALVPFSEPPSKQCHTCGFVGQEDPVKGCPKCGFDDMRTIQSKAGFLPDWEFDVHDDDDGLTWLNIYPPHGAVAAFSVQTKRRDGQTTIAAEVLRKFVKAIKAAQLQANSPFCPGCGSTECDQPAAPALVPWQPIETAPKNGTELLGWREDCGVLLIRWTAPIHFMTDTEIERESSDDNDWIEQYDWFCADFVGFGGRLDGSETPTYWMPLPPAPVGIGQPVGGER